MKPSLNVFKRLYIKEKKSSFEIANLLNCSENKVNYWLKKYGIPKRSISEAVYIKNNPKGDPFTIKEKLSKREIFLFGLGLGLYWGEGTKRDKYSVRLGNSDPELIIKFLEFLITIFNIDKSKLRFGLQVFSDTPPSKTLNFWLKKLNKFGINKNQFFKVIITPSRGIGNYKEKAKFGVLTIHFGNSKLKQLFDRYIADVAQLVEHDYGKVGVAGSIPAIGSNKGD